LDEVMETVIKDMLEKAAAKGIESGAKAERERIRREVEKLLYPVWDEMNLFCAAINKKLRQVLELLNDTPGEG